MNGKLIKTNLHIGQNVWERVEEDVSEDVSRDEFVKLVDHLIDMGDLTIYGDLSSWVWKKRETLYRLSRMGFGTHYEALGLACELLDHGFDSVTKDGYRVSKVGEEGLFFRVEETGEWKDIGGMTINEFKEYRTLEEKDFSTGQLKDFTVGIGNIKTGQKASYPNSSAVNQSGNFYKTDTNTWKYSKTK